jgi:hypothetical protein
MSLLEKSLGFVYSFLSHNNRESFLHLFKLSRTCTYCPPRMKIFQLALSLFTSLFLRGKITFIPFTRFLTVTSVFLHTLSSKDFKYSNLHSQLSFKKTIKCFLHFNSPFLWPVFLHTPSSQGFKNIQTCTITPLSFLWETITFSLFYSPFLWLFLSFCLWLACCSCLHWLLPLQLGWRPLQTDRQPH